MSTGGLVPVLALAESAGLRGLADEHLSVATDKGAHAGLKVASLVGGMVAGPTERREGPADPEWPDMGLPEPGHAHLIARVDATYLGGQEDSASAWGNLGFTVVGASGNTYDTWCMPEDDLSEENEMFAGASVSGNVCIDVPVDDLDGAAWIIETWSIDHAADM